MEESRLEAAFCGDARPRACVSLPADIFSATPPLIGKFVSDAITKELRADPVEHPIFLLEPPHVSEEVRCKTNGHISQILFETLLVPAIFLAPRASLASQKDPWRSINAACQQLGDGEWLTREEFVQYWETTFASHQAAIVIEQIREKLVKMGILFLTSF